MPIKLHLKPFLYTLLTFIVFTIIGTLSHELGHIAVAKSLGRKTSLHYGYMLSENVALNRIYEEHKEAIDNKQPFPQQDKFEALLTENRRYGILITWGGPLQTMLSGSLGLVLLYVRRRKRCSNGFAIWDWVGVMLTLFWLRPLANFVHNIIRSIYLGETLFSGRSDEIHLSGYYHLYPGFFTILFGGLAFGIAVYVVFWIVPKPLRFTFISGGMVGGLLGYYLWLIKFGPVLMP